MAKRRLVCRLDGCDRSRFAEGKCVTHCLEARERRGDLCRQPGCGQVRFGGDDCRSHHKAKYDRRVYDRKREQRLREELGVDEYRRRLAMQKRRSRGTNPMVPYVPASEGRAPRSKPRPLVRREFDSLTVFDHLPRRRFVEGPCAQCGDRFLVLLYAGEALYCSERCKWKAKDPGYWISDRDRQAIYERDRWVCQLCFEPVDRDADPVRDAWSPTLDHILAREFGGSHEPENLRLAHRWCNSVRGNGTRDLEGVF